MSSTITIGGGDQYSPVLSLDPNDSVSTEGIFFFEAEGIFDTDGDTAFLSLKQGDTFEGHWIGLTATPIDEALTIGFDAFDVIVDI